MNKRASTIKWYRQCMISHCRVSAEHSRAWCDHSWNSFHKLQIFEWSSVTLWQSCKVNSEDICSAANKFAEDNTSTSLLLVSIPYLCLLSLPNLITAYLGSPFIPGDVDNVKMDEWPLRWHSYVRWWCGYLPLLNNLRVISVSGLQAEDGEHQLSPAKRLRVHSDAVKASQVWVFSRHALL